MLSAGKALRNGCLQCPYHGLCVGDTHSADVPPVGICKEQDGIVWWNRFATEETIDAAPRIPGCDYIQEASDRQKPTVRFEIELKGSFNDAFRNAFDVYHPAFLHTSSFGNELGAPSTLTEAWLDSETMRMDFSYKSNEKFEKRTGKTTENHHIFQFPSTVYNVVQAKRNNVSKALLIHLAMRATSEKTTRWFVTAASDFLPHESVLEIAVRRVAEKEDAKQISVMASEDMKAKYAYRMGLPLDAHTAGVTYGVGAIRAAEKRLTELIGELKKPHPQSKVASLLDRAWAEATELMRWEKTGWNEASDSLSQAEQSATQMPPLPLRHAKEDDFVLEDWDCLAELSLPKEEQEEDHEPSWSITEQEAEAILDTAVQRNNIISSPWAPKKKPVATPAGERVQGVLYRSERIAIVFSGERATPAGTKEGFSKASSTYKWEVWMKPGAEELMNV